MSHNIISCNIKKIENLEIPLKALYESERKDWHPEQPKILSVEDFKVRIEMGCDQSIEGTLENPEILKVTDMEVEGEGSGSNLHYVLEHAFEESTGELQLNLTWEDGSLSIMKVSNGNLTHEDYEF
tara:strand:- start:119 stop:496 length:378 start_codon:yes stop_codon:yes gene_type:complete